VAVNFKAYEMFIYGDITVWNTAGLLEGQLQHSNNNNIYCA